MDICRQYRSGEHLNFENLKKADDGELLELKIQVDQDIARIGTQLNSAKTNAAVNGVYSNPAWFSKATSAKRIKGQLSQSIQAELGRRKIERARINREICSKDVVHSLFEAMDFVLSPDQKEKVITKFKELRGE